MSVFLHRVLCLQPQTAQCSSWRKMKGLGKLKDHKITAGLGGVAMRGTRMNCLSRIKSRPGVNPAALG